MIRTKRITSGGWRTVETFWNAAGTAFFKAPAGAQIKVRYGVGWFGFDRQKQTLNGNDYKKTDGRTGIAGLCPDAGEGLANDGRDLRRVRRRCGEVFARNKVLSFGIHGARQSIKDLSVRWNAID